MNTSLVLKQNNRTSMIARSATCDKADTSGMPDFPMYETMHRHGRRARHVKSSTTPLHYDQRFRMTCDSTWEYIGHNIYITSCLLFFLRKYELFGSGSSPTATLGGGMTVQCTNWLLHSTPGLTVLTGSSPSSIHSA